MDIEPRWPPILAFLFVVGLVHLLPGRYIVAGPWLPWLFLVLGVGTMIVAGRTKQLLWLQIERATIITISIITIGLTAYVLFELVRDMLVAKHGYGSIMLLETAIQLWTVNLVSFSLLYWRFDYHSPTKPLGDFSFESAEGTLREPHFIDYLFMAFSTSTSFTAPDFSRPTTERAKLVLMLQALISLITLFLIAARAIATLT